MTSHIASGKRELISEPLPASQDLTQTIPPEIALKILSFMQPADLLEMKLLNRQWRVYSQDEMFSRFAKRFNETFHQIEPLFVVIQPHISQDSYDSCHDSFLRLQRFKETLKSSRWQDPVHVQSSIVPIKGAMDKFRRDLILSLSLSTTAFDPVQANSLLNAPVDLQGELEHIIRLAQAIQQMNVVVENEIIARNRFAQFDVILASHFFNPLYPPLSQFVIEDILAVVVNSDVAKILMVKLLSTDESLVDQFMERFSDGNKDFIFQKWTSIMIGRNDFDAAKEKIECIKDKVFKAHAIKELVMALIRHGATDKAIEILYGVDYLDLKSRKQLFGELGKVERFSEQELRSPEVIATFLVNIQAALHKQDFSAFYESFFGIGFVSVGNELDQVKASIADTLIERREFSLAMLIAVDKALNNLQLIKDLRTKIFHNYLQALPQDSVAKDLAIKELFTKLPDVNKTEVRAKLIVSMLQHGLYEEAVIQLQKTIPRDFKDRSYSYEYLQVNLQEVVNSYIEQEDYRKVLGLSHYIDGRNQILFSCILDKVNQSQEGSFETRWNRIIEECFPELSLKDREFLELYNSTLQVL